MSRVVYFLIRIFICRNRHNPVRDIRDNGYWITRYSCVRCNCSLGFGKCKYLPVPPGSNYTQEQWNKIYLNMIMDEYKITSDEIRKMREVKLNKLI